MERSVWCAFAILLAACGDDSNARTPNIATNGAAGTTAATGAAAMSGSSGTGSSGAGSSGTGSSGTGVSGTGVSGTGVSGTGVSGTGVSGTGSSGTGGSGTDDPCAADSGLSGSALHAAVATFLGTEPGSCNGAACHDSSGPPRAVLQLGGMTDMNATLVGVTSCEAPNLPLIAPGDPLGSFLWLKVYAAEVDSRGQLVSLGDVDGGTPGNCGQPAGTYGERMPLTIGTGTASRERLIELCDWIQSGAPGP